jgi:hypothetical protein
LFSARARNFLSLHAISVTLSSGSNRAGCQITFLPITLSSQVALALLLDTLSLAIRSPLQAKSQTLEERRREQRVGVEVGGVRAEVNQGGAGGECQGRM